MHIHLGQASPVIGGGRYDKLVGQFGREKAAIGFSITLDSLMAAITRQNIDIPVDINGTLLVYNSQNLSQAVSVADSLRKKGIRVCMTSCNSEKTKEQYVEYAADSQLANAVFLPDCTNADVSSAEFLGLTVQTTDVKDNCTKNITVEQLLGGKY